MTQISADSHRPNHTCYFRCLNNPPMALRNSFILLILPAMLAACGERDSSSRGPIVLGDSSTIVTENDPTLLQDLVPDLKPVLSEEDTAATTKDTTQAQQQAPATAQAAATDGLVVPFKEVTLNIPGIETRSYSKPDLQKAHGATYELSSGKLQGNELRISGGAVSKVSQRCQTMLMLKDGSDELLLESLPKQTSDWEEISGSNGVYRISGLSEKELDYKLPSASALRRAVQRDARRARLSRKATQDWLDAVRHLRSAHQSPAVVVLRAVMWRVEGKGFYKELRVDVPVK